VGTDCAAADFEILFMIKNSLEKLGVQGFRIHLAHRGIFNAFLEQLGLEKEGVEILRTVDKLSKVGEETVKELLEPLTGSEKGALILEYIRAEKTPAQTLEKLTRLVGADNPSISRVGELFRLAEQTGIDEMVILDPAITRGLDYYTGVVYETFLTDLPELGSVCSGGRYNNLAGLYTRQELPGVGASIGLDRLLAGLEELGRLSAKDTTTRVLVFNMADSLMGHYFYLAQELRNQDISSEIFLESRKMNKQFQFAERKGIPWALICGDDEMKAGKMNLKNLMTRDSHEAITLDEAVAILKNEQS
jgi:histidyl-tRNA synthetase